MAICTVDVSREKFSGLPVQMAGIMSTSTGNEGGCKDHASEASDSEAGL
jgi:hypothetical protein